MRQPKAGGKLDLQLRYGEHREILQRVREAQRIIGDGSDYI